MLEAAFIEARHSRPVNPTSSGTNLIRHDHAIRLLLVRHRHDQVIMKLRAVRWGAGQDAVDFVFPRLTTARAAARL
jgi:hypothetical protein